jgi:hypothetical protein
MLRGFGKCARRRLPSASERRLERLLVSILTGTGCRAWGGRAGPHVHVVLSCCTPADCFRASLSALSAATACCRDAAGCADCRAPGQAHVARQLQGHATHDIIRYKPAAGVQKTRIRSKCKECGGSGICEHGRRCRQRRSECKECGGGSICEHGRILYAASATSAEPVPRFLGT